MPLIVEKACKKCGIYKSLDEFREYKNKDSSGLRHVCRKCEKWKYPKGYMNRFNKNDSHKRAVKKYRESEHGKNKARNSYYKRKYHITLKQYDKMFEEQKGLCAICGQPEIGRRLSVDHCHKTGRVRKLLCYSCNCCIGFIEIKNLSIKKIRKYLEV